MSVKDLIKKGDILIIVLCVTACLCLFASSFSSGENLTAEIYFDGELIKTQELSEIEEEYTLSVSGCELELSKNGVRFLSSTCGDKLCTKHGILSKKGETMACVPNKVVVSIKEGKDKNFDAVAY